MSASASDTSTQEELTARDPATGATLGSVAITPPERVDEVVEAVAKVQPLWALLRVKDRARYMGRMAQAVIDDFDELQEGLAREQGRPRAEIAALELLAAIDALMWIADDGADVLGGRRVGINRSLTVAKRARIAFEPYGVVGVIGAGSAPFAQPLGQIAGALLAGNGVVFKPAARACLAGERIARVLARAGLPEGLVRVVHGAADVGVALAQSPVSKILFTGSPAVGRVVARACVSREKEVTVELGGKDAMLVLADAHLRRAIAGALWAGCAGAGQARGSIERVYVAREVYERFLAGLVSGARALSVGDPADPRVQVGPLASARRAEHVGALVEEAVAQGARLHCGGPVSPPGCDAGTFYAPAVITEVSSEMRVLREPVDGPVLVVVPVDSIDEAIALANDGDYCLGASVWTRRPLPGDADRARAARGHGVAQRPPPRPDRLARPVGRGRRRRPRPDARSGGPASVRAGEADHLGSAGHARAVVGALRRHQHQGHAGGGEAALRARVRPRPRLARRRAGAGARGRARFRAGAAALAGPARLHYSLSDARPGLCRQGVRLSAAQGDLRPELRAGDARHPLLHRLPEARPAGAAW